MAVVQVVHRRDPRAGRRAPTARARFLWTHLGDQAASGSVAVLIAISIGAVGFGFMLFTVSSSLWAFARWVPREASLVVLRGVFLVIDVFGVYN